MKQFLLCLMLVTLASLTSVVFTHTAAAEDIAE
jgi:hypothetical protein